MRILLIEDDRKLSDSIADELRVQFFVNCAYDGKTAEVELANHDFDLMIVDLVLPDIDGIELCQKLRSKKILTPILMLTGRGEVAHKVRALDSGADDYLTKPFSMEELFARIRALLRRNPEAMCSNILQVGGLCIDLKRKSVTRDNVEVSLRKKEFDLLEYFARNPGQVLTRNMILNNVWDKIGEFGSNIVDVHIKYLRDQVDKPFGTPLIKTVHGLGYKLEV